MRSCRICGTTQGIEKHHCFFNKNRNNSEKYKLTVDLCSEHHRGNYSPHKNREVDLIFKREAQARFEEHHEREAFLKIFGRNYL